MIGPVAPVRSTGPSSSATPSSANRITTSGDRLIHDEAQVAASRHWLTSLRLELASGLVKIDLADAERKRPATGTEGDDFHAEHPCVEGDRRVKIGDGEHKMVKPVDLHR
jgi:hypothetical protein